MTRVSRRALICSLPALVLASAGAATAQAAPAATPEVRRLALVMGNAKYRSASVLANPINDARDMAGALRGLGFQVFEVYDGDLTAMEAAVSTFTRAIRPGDAALVFYAGHGVQGIAPRPEDGTDNYLVPIDAEFESAERVPAEALALTTVLERMDRAKAGTRIVILDACRNNPFARRWTAGRAVAASGGLTQPTSSTLRGVYVAFATSPGSVAADTGGGRNGLFTQELLKRIGQPGQSVNNLFEEVSEAVELASRTDQIPWFSGSGTAARFVFKPGARPAALEPAVAAAQPQAEPPPGSLPRQYANLPPKAKVFMLENQDQPLGQLRIGVRFLRGVEDFPVTPAEGLGWLRRAAGGGSAEAALRLGVAYYQGQNGLQVNHAQARQYFEQAVRGDHPMARTLLGNMHHFGEGGLKRDQAAALALYRQAAEANDALGLGALGVYYETGAAGLRKNESEARRLYERALLAGHPAAQSYLDELDKARR